MEPITLPPVRDAVFRDRSSFEDTRKRFRSTGTPYRPVLILNDEGTLVEVTSTARRLLEYRADEPMKPCFFTHVHGKNLYRVMRDVADMVCHGKKSASWLLRMRTGRGRWRWYQADVSNHLDDTEPTIHVVLSDLNGW